MSKIYAPLNAVNTYRTHKTAVPLDVTLTDEDKRRLIALEKAHANNQNAAILINTFDIRDTPNVGIHFFCVEKAFALRMLAKNPHLSPLMVFLINSKIDAINSTEKLSTRYSLLTNPAVCADLNVFKMVFNSVGNDTEILARSLPSIIKVAPVSLFMFLMPMVADLNDEKLNRLFLAAAYEREEKIFAWLRENFEDLSVLPFSWVLATYGLKD